MLGCYCQNFQLTKPEMQCRFQLDRDMLSLLAEYQCNNTKNTSPSIVQLVLPGLALCRIVTVIHIQLSKEAIVANVCGMTGDHPTLLYTGTGFSLPRLQAVLAVSGIVHAEHICVHLVKFTAKSAHAVLCAPKVYHPYHPYVVA